MKRAYIAGKLNAEATDYLANCSRMIKLGIEARKAGFAVFIPCLDLLAGIVDGNLRYRDFFDNSQPWLRVSDAVLVVSEGYRGSQGTTREIESAEKHDIPVFFSLKNMQKHFKDKQ